MISVRSMRVRTVLAAGVLAAAAGSPAWAMPEEDFKALTAQLSEKVSEARRAGTMNQQVLGEIVDATMTDAQVAEMTPDQLWQLAGAVMHSDRRSAAMGRLDELAQQADAEGAKAAITRVRYIDSQQAPGDAAAALTTGLRHAGVGELLRTDDGGMMTVFVMMSEDSLRRAGPEILAFAGRLDEGVSTGVLTRSMGMYEGLMNLGEEHAAERERIRTRLVGLIDKAAADADPAVRSRLERGAAYLKGAYMRGALVGHPAPALTFTWSSDPSISSMADLQGKVVVVDFWATWCGPCIASFPQVRDLAERYKDHPVVVLGATSIQGAHFGEGGRVDTKGDPAKEHALMKEFMSWKEMTWPVVFTEQDVFNPDFGVQGIPHVAIIDTKGVVRYRGLHPGMNPEDKFTKIDGLLREAGLPTP